MSPEGERAADLLRFANYAKVGEALGRSRAAVARWAKGKQVTPWQLNRLEELLANTQTAAAPDVSERLLAGVIALERRVGVTDADLDAARAQARQIVDRLSAGQ